MVLFFRDLERQDALPSGKIIKINGLFFKYYLSIFFEPLSTLGGVDNRKEIKHCTSGQGLLAFECQSQLNIKEKKVNKPGTSSQNLSVKQVLF